MPDEKRFDPFRPPQPQIPGVAAVVVEERAAATSEPESPIQSPPKKNGWRVAATLGGVLILSAFIGWWSHKSRSGNGTSGSAASAPVLDAAANDVQTAQNLPVGPGEIATTEELSKPWSAKQFLFHNPLTDSTLPAMVVRLPGGSYWGFSVREPYGNCKIELVTDLQKLQSDYNFTASHPMLGDPCDRSVFDLTLYGTAPSGLVRGEIVQGPAIRPPVAIEIRVTDHRVFADRME